MGFFWGSIKRKYSNIKVGLLKGKNVRSAAALNTFHKTICLFDPELQSPKHSENDPKFSTDVFTIDKEGAVGMAFYSFDEHRWIFYFETLPSEEWVRIKTKWKWFYPPLSDKDLKW